MIFDMARDFLGTEKETTIIFEDALHAIRTAKKAGYPVIGVYDQSEGISEKEIIDLCDAYYPSLKECKL